MSNEYGEFGKTIQPKYSILLCNPCWLSPYVNLDKMERSANGVGFSNEIFMHMLIILRVQVWLQF